MPTVKNSAGAYRVFFYSFDSMSQNMSMFKEKS